MDIMHLIAAAAQQQATLSGTPSGPESYYSYEDGTETDDWQTCYLAAGSDSVTFGASYITLTAFGNAMPPISGESSIATASKVDLTDFSTIDVGYDPGVYTLGTIYICIDDTYNNVSYATYDYRSSESVSGSSDGISLDISGISGEYYIRVHLTMLDPKTPVAVDIDSIYISTE